MRRSFQFLGLAAAATTLALMSSRADAQLAEKPLPRPDHWTIIRADTLMARADQPAAKNMSIVVHNDKIESIRPGSVRPEDLAGVPPGNISVVDLPGKFVMAGLMDAHVHIGLGTLTFAMQNARSKVAAGATTVRDAGSDPAVIFPLRDAINQGLAVGPRILASGALISVTGGHGDGRNGDWHAAMEPPAFDGGICDGVEECQKAVRKQIQFGADQIKMVATAGIMDDANVGMDQQFTDEEMKAIVTTAHMMKRKVMAHAIGTVGIKAAVQAGVESIEHGYELDDEGAEMMKRHGTYLVATLEAPTELMRWVKGSHPAGMRFSENSRRKLLALPEAKPGYIGRQVRLAVRHAVKLGIGTDFGGSPSDEMVLMVREGGISAQDALKAATIGNADLLGISDIAGTIEPGKSADIVAFEGDPRDQIENATKIAFVMAQGREVVGPGFILP